MRLIYKFTLILFSFSCCVGSAKAQKKIKGPKAQKMYNDTIATKAHRIGFFNNYNDFPNKPIFMIAAGGEFSFPIREFNKMGAEQSYLLNLNLDMFNYVVPSRLAINTRINLASIFFNYDKYAQYEKDKFSSYIPYDAKISGASYNAESSSSASNAHDSFALFTGLYFTLPVDKRISLNLRFLAGYYVAKSGIAAEYTKQENNVEVNYGVRNDIGKCMYAFNYGASVTYLVFNGLNIDLALGFLNAKNSVNNIIDKNDANNKTIFPVTEKGYQTTSLVNIDFSIRIQINKGAKKYIDDHVRARILENQQH